MGPIPSLWPLRRQATRQSIKQILDQLGLWLTQAAKPPPAAHEVRVVRVDKQGREIGEAW